jgi:hypothetical protein
MTERQGAFTVPTRLFLSPEHRLRLERLVREQEVDLAELISQIVADYLDTLPDAPPPPPTPAADLSTQLRQRRAELARLRAQGESAGPRAPDWLAAYIADLEADIRRLES